MSTTAPTTTTPLKPALRTARRAAWLALALFWSAFAVLEGVNHGWLAGLFALALFIAPDLTFFAALGATDPVRQGQLPARAVPFYNAAHRALIPLALMVAYTLLSLPWAPLFAGMCGWLAHISYDRAFGYGLRTKEGFQRA
ncbi:DUF4260 family protein [Streptomyces sp. cg28]|uniref:DUF4260 family protein n=1 Tax=Streptomyces sp. cg28 TaxID=3403457 RepID=UPI003B22612B